MFDHLIESNRKSNKKGAFGLGFVSLVGHSIIVLAAVVATLTAGQKDGDTSTQIASIENAISAGDKLSRARLRIVATPSTH